MISIYQFGTFDVANLGDLLLPLLAQKGLAPLNAKRAAVSPIGAPPVWEDCTPSFGINEIMNYSDRPEGVLIGGGNIFFEVLPVSSKNRNSGVVQIDSKWRDPVM